jgi:hypothetical protein
MQAPHRITPPHERQTRESAPANKDLARLKALPEKPRIEKLDPSD